MIENILETNAKRRLQTSFNDTCSVCCWTFLSAFTYSFDGLLRESINSGFVSFLLTKNSAEMNPVRIFKVAGNKDLSKLIRVLQSDQEFQKNNPVL